MRRLNLSSTKNTRDLGGYPLIGGGSTQWGAFLRSDAPAEIVQQDVDCLKGYGVTHVLDLRQPIEQQRRIGFAGGQGFNVHTIPFGGGQPPEEPSMVAKSYMDIAMDFSAMGQAMEYLAWAPGCVLFHCTAGKDRTGVISAVLLALAGVPLPDVLADYQLSQVYLWGRITAHLQRHPELNPAVITPQVGFMAEFFDLLYDKYPRIQDYFMAMGLGEAQIHSLLKKLVG